MPLSARSHGKPRLPHLSPSTRSVDLGKRSVYTHFPKDRNCKICQRTKITRWPCRWRIGRVVPRAENFSDFHYSRSQSSVKVVNLETIIDMQLWCRTWPLNRSKHIRARPKLLWKQKRACKSSWSQIESLKSFTLTIPWNLAKLVLSWNHCTSTPHRSETNGIAERAVRRVKEGTSAVLLQSYLDAKWWADSMECCTYLRNIQDLLSDGKTPHERRFGQRF